MLADVRSLQISAFIVLVDVIAYLLGNMNFKTCQTYYLTGLAITYMIMLGVGYWDSWYAFTALALFKTTVIYLMVFSLVHGYFYRMAKGNADEINHYLKEGK